MPEPIAPPPVPLEERQTWTPLERIRALEVYQIDHGKRIENLETGDKSMTARFDKLDKLLLAATSAIIGSGVVLKIIPPGAIEIVKHLFGV